VRATITVILEEEVEAVVGASRYERSEQRQNYRSGTRTRDLMTSGGLIEDLAVPRTRNGFQTQVFERYRRRMSELDRLMSEMFIGGVSQVKVGEAVSHLTASPLGSSASTVSRVFHSLEAEFNDWKTRSLPRRYEYVFVDGTYFSVIYDGQGHKMPILALVGITPQGQREVIAFSVGERENQHAWEHLLSDVKARGVVEVGLWITDGHQAMLNALDIQFPKPTRQRCVVHKMANIMSYVPTSQQEEVHHALKAIFYQDTRVHADQVAAAFMLKYESIYPTAIDCMRRDWAACLTFYQFPKLHWSTIRTNNAIERLFEEIKKRSKKMSAAFRNENSCLLMCYAVVRSLKFRNVKMPSSLLHTS
jgi:transposase-like protein